MELKKLWRIIDDRDNQLSKKLKWKCRLVQFGIALFGFALAIDLFGSFKNHLIIYNICYWTFGMLFAELGYYKLFYEIVFRKKTKSKKINYEGFANGTN